jgi:asparagine synthase (glutamine-hydrolysing)
MCGIAGVLSFDGEPASPVLLRRMADALGHRGPDGEGVVTDGGLGFAHRRLAIIDRSSAGHQPMQTRDGRIVLNYNGELFNFQDLRAELQALGHPFRGYSDTEVLLEAWAEWGVAALERFNGMFAFAVWDRERRELVLCRDRYGVKPLYWSRRGDALVFGSEIKAMLCHPAVQARLDPAALAEYLTFQNVFSERTLFAGVSLLPAGTHLTVSERGEIAGPRRWWDFAFSEPERPEDPREYEEELARLFTQAVQRQLVADVPLSSYLSGGVDSGSITTIAARELPNLRTFTVGFDLRSASGMELAFDEREEAEHMSYLAGTEHYEMVLKAGDMQRIMPRLVWHLEDLRVGQSYPNFYAAQLAGKFARVVLSGAGGDELFGGYPWRYYRAVVEDDFEHYADRYYDYWQRLLPAPLLEEVLRPVWTDVAHVSTRELFRSIFDDRDERLERAEDSINHSLYFEAKTFLHGVLLVEDKLSMAHSVETRVPFLDNDLVDFAQRLPVSLKLRDLDSVVRLNENEPGPKSQRFFERSNDGKLLLRRVLRRHVPEHTAAAEKQGFSGPDASWFRGESIDYVRERLMGRDARIYDVLDRDAVQRLVGSHLEGRENRRLLIWSLLCLEQWCECFLDGRAPDPSVR